jgi:hypothetical protein
MTPQPHRLDRWGPVPAVTFDAEACRRWLTDDAADQHGIDEGFCTTGLRIPAGLHDLLDALHDTPQPQVWRLHPAIGRIKLWRTADGDGIDGGAIITADLVLGQDRVRLATQHQGFDEFTADSDTAGIDAAVEALGNLAALVNAEFDAYRKATRTFDDAVSGTEFTVVGVWDDDVPVPVGVVCGAHEVTGGDDQHWTQGVWATSVSAADASAAEREAVVEMRAS